MPAYTRGKTIKADSKHHPECTLTHGKQSAIKQTPSNIKNARIHAMKQSAMKRKFRVDKLR
eukprot:9631621-Prorocentrum_lima.AAC.1